MRRLFLAVILASVTVLAQSDSPASASQTDKPSQQITLPVGTRVLLELKSPIDTKHAKPGDGVYCMTTFPVTQDNVAVIPAGTYIKGRIAEVHRAGRVKGRAEVLFHFTTLIYPSGYTIELPGSLDNIPGATNENVSDKEGTVKADSTKGKDAATVAKTGATGAVVGAVVGRDLKGAGIGGAAGAAVGLAQVLLTRGPDVRLPTGTALEMVLERPLTVDVSHSDSDRAIVPRSSTDRRMKVPPPNPR
jgi:hypothetical protein